MLFLMNDVVLNVEGASHSPSLPARRFRPLTFHHVGVLGQELYADEPLLHLTHPERARRLASLIIAKAPSINAALFLAPLRGCSPREVSLRYCHVDFELMAGLLSRQQAGELDLLSIDRNVWKRLAA